MAKPVGPRFRQPLRKWNSGLENCAPVSRLPFVRINRPFPSSKTHFQSEAKCEAIDMKMIFNYDANKTHFHNKGFALSLVLKVKFFGTRKWPIPFTGKRPRRPETGIKDDFEEIEHEFLFGISRPEKQDYLYRCSVAPGNFPLERPKKSCSIYFPTRFSRIFL